MFTTARLIALVVVSLLLTALLYWLDSDPMTDTIGQMAAVAAVSLFIVTMLYACAYGLTNEIRKAAKRKTA